MMLYVHISIWSNLFQHIQIIFRLSGHPRRRHWIAGCPHDAGAPVVAGDGPRQVGPIPWPQLQIKHGWLEMAGKSTLIEGFNRKIVDKWSIVHCDI